MENGTQVEIIEGNFVEPQTTKNSNPVGGSKQALSPPIIKKNTNNAIVVDRIE